MERPGAVFKNNSKYFFSHTNTEISKKCHIFTMKQKSLKLFIVTQKQKSLNFHISWTDLSKSIKNIQKMFYSSTKTEIFEFFIFHGPI